MTGLSLYFHWPFCLAKCPYCDFNSYAGQTPDQERWRQAFAREMTFYAEPLKGRTIETIYFGGGTPSLMEEKTVDFLLQQAAKNWRLASDCEITLEANPSSVEIGKFRSFKTSGVNRLSIGVQSFDDAALKFLGRIHSAEEARAALGAASTVFSRFTFDLIYARAGQSLEAWSDEMEEALSFGPRHLSLYQLTIEERTAFFKQQHERKLTADEEAAIEFYNLTNERMARVGLLNYEVSNYAVPGEESRHNLVYWRTGDYLGFGPGAHGRYPGNDARQATENRRSPDLWLQAVEKTGRGLEKEEALEVVEVKEEALLMGLRLTRGLDLSQWRARFGESLTDFVSLAKIERLQQEGLVHFSGENLAATPAGRLRLNALIGFLV